MIITAEGQPLSDKEAADRDIPVPHLSEERRRRLAAAIDENMRFMGSIARGSQTSEHEDNGGNDE